METWILFVRLYSYPPLAIENRFRLKKLVNFNVIIFAQASFKCGNFSKWQIKAGMSALETVNLSHVKPNLTKLHEQN